MEKNDLVTGLSRLSGRCWRVVKERKQVNIFGVGPGSLNEKVQGKVSKKRAEQEGSQPP